MKKNPDDDIDLVAALSQCQKAYSKFLLAANSVIAKGYMPVFDIHEKPDGEYTAVNWRLEEK